MSYTVIAGVTRKYLWAKSIYSHSLALDLELAHCISS